jgi:hypothetical protein
MPPRDRLIRLHIQNDPLSPNDAVTPPRFAKGASGFRDLRRRLGDGRRSHSRTGKTDAGGRQKFTAFQSAFHWRSPSFVCRRKEPANVTTIHPFADNAGNATPQKRTEETKSPCCSAHWPQVAGGPLLTPPASGRRRRSSRCR